MSCKRLLATLSVIMAVSFCPVASISGGEWEDYMGSPYHDFRWDWLVRDGHLAYAKGRYKEALEIYQQAMDKGGKDPLMLFRMGYCYRTLRKDKEASGHFAASMDGLKTAYPKHKYNWLSRYYLAEMLAEEGRPDRAKQQLDQAIRLNPRFEQAYLLYGNLHYRTGEYGFAAEKYRSATEANPKSLQAFLNLGAAYEAMGETEKAISAYTSAKSIAPRDMDILLSLAGLYSRAGHLQKAMEQYSEILQIEPNSEIALLGTARAAWATGEQDRAVEFYQKALAVNLRSYEALLGLGLAMLKAGELDKAEDYLKKTLDVNPESKEAHYNLGVLYQTKGDFDAAIREFVRAIEIAPDDETCYYNVGLSFLKAGFYEQAREWLNKAVEKFGTESKWSKADLKLLELIARIEKGREAEIEKELEKALQGDEERTAP